ncbi:RNA polymerase sigma factor [Candidatus Poribacteria bacterium]|nr:RNA polymerase sigma factor [Candidatus Poribacteria bacterium]
MSLSSGNRDESVKKTAVTSFRKKEGAAEVAKRTEKFHLDDVLFRAFRDGDFAAMQGIVEAYHKRLIGFIRLYTHSYEIAEELTQEVFLLAYQHRAKIRSLEDLRPWLFTVAKREALREIKRKRYTAEILLDEESLRQLSLSVPPEQDYGIRLDELGTQLREVLATLKPRDRELIILRYFMDLQIKEISQVAKIPMGSVGVMLGRALEKLRAEFEKRGLALEDFATG